MLPADGEAAGGWIEDAHVPGAGSGHCGNTSLTHSLIPARTGQHVGTFICLVTSNKWKRVTTSVLVVVLPQQPHPPPRPIRSHRVALTCFARVADGGALPIGVERRHTDGIGSVRNQVVQEGVANISWNQNLFEKKEVC